MFCANYLLPSFCLHHAFRTVEKYSDQWSLVQTVLSIVINASVSCVCRLTNVPSIEQRQLVMFGMAPAVCCMWGTLSASSVFWAPFTKHPSLSPATALWAPRLLQEIESHRWPLTYSIFCALKFRNGIHEDDQRPNWRWLQWLSLPAHSSIEGHWAPQFNGLDLRLPSRSHGMAFLLQDSCGAGGSLQQSVTCSLHYERNNAFCEKSETDRTTWWM